MHKFSPSDENFDIGRVIRINDRGVELDIDGVPALLPIQQCPPTKAEPYDVFLKPDMHLSVRVVGRANRKDRCYIVALDGLALWKRKIGEEIGVAILEQKRSVRIQ